MINKKEFRSNLNTNTSHTKNLFKDKITTPPHKTSMLKSTKVNNSNLLNKSNKKDK